MWNSYLFGRNILIDLTRIEQNQPKKILNEQVQHAF